MFATFLVVGLTCWLVMFSPVEAASADEIEASPLFDDLGSLHHPITTTSELANSTLIRGSDSSMPSITKKRSVRLKLRLVRIRRRLCPIGDCIGAGPISIVRWEAR